MTTTISVFDVLTASASDDGKLQIGNWSLTRGFLVETTQSAAWVAGHLTAEAAEIIAADMNTHKPWERT